MNGRDLAIVVALLLLLVAALAFYGPFPVVRPGETVLGTSSGWTVQPPPGYDSEEPDPEQETRVNLALLNGEPLPEGWTLVDQAPRITASWTGRRHALTGMLELEVVLEDEPADVESVRLLVNGAERGSRTRADGSLEERAGLARAAFAVWLPRWWSSDLALEWTMPNGLELDKTWPILPWRDR